MLVSVRKKHWLVLSISATGVLLLLVFNVKPPMLQPSRTMTGDAEVGFLRRRIANDDGEVTGIGGPPPPPPEPRLDPSLQSSLSELGREPAPPFTQIPIHLSEKERAAYAKQGILLVEDEGSSDSLKGKINPELPAKQEEKQHVTTKLTEEQLQQKQQMHRQGRFI
ncbi:hypothetical protein SK128_009034 [Halocaridina rubra]|uniref:Uncharacterized protein n=1 Tax=Halocaridina rubra TaxID=373956 RepID=A0AAN8X457_HALRR